MSSLTKPAEQKKFAMKSVRREREVESINQLRCRIDDIDTQLARLLQKRLILAREIGLRKTQSGLPVKNPAREEQVIRRISSAVTDDKQRSAIQNIFRTIIDQSVQEQTGLATKSEFLDSFSSVCIIGAGLIGGALAGAIRARDKSRNFVSEVRALDLPSRLDACRESKLFSICHDDLSHTVIGADLIVLSAPPAQNLALLKEIAPLLREGQVVMDTSSVKAPICDLAEKLNLNGAVFVGGHPFFGTEKQGLENSHDVAVQGKPFCLIGQENNLHLSRLRVWLQSLGLHVIICADAAIHDRIVARTSHIIQFTALLLGKILDDDIVEQDLTSHLALSGGGLAGIARLMGSPSDLWLQIFEQNKLELRALLETMRTLTGELCESDEEGFSIIVGEMFRKSHRTTYAISSATNPG